MIQRARVPLGFIVAGAVFYLAEPTGISMAVGLPVAVAGALLRLMAAGVIQKDARLATTGAYAWTRNPLYFGSFLLAVGFAIMSANVIAAALLIGASVIVYPIVIRKEERRLEQLFPEEFRRYKAQAPCFFPRFRSLKTSFSFSQYMANKEYNAAMGFVAALGILIVKWLRC